MNIIKIQEQLDSNRRSVAFDSYDITLKQLYDMVLEGMVDIAPEYQRHFVWDSNRQSALIESLFLGIPIPSLFMASNRDASWEVIDGLQRLTTILNFIGNDNELKNILIKHEKLKLSGLEKLDSMNGLIYDDLPKSMQFMLQTRPLRITVLNDRSDFNVRYDLFERLNTGGVTLHEQEIRNCVYIGPFNDFIKDLSVNSDFRAVVKMTANAERSGSYEELVLRFFAYHEDAEQFVHSVKGFLNEFMEKKTESFKDKESKELKKIFQNTFKVLRDNLPDGIVRGARKNITPVVLYEAISVGCAKAIGSGENYAPEKLEALLNDPEVKKSTTGATNSKKMVLKRINIVKDTLVNGI
ncbi:MULTISPECIES: GmrSD restriction endonuclease domain-containing protein [Shewanella]|uniref:DUF262 domain-containing protein n=1 Tax=Shewanella psychromarinicola TaxID=2487742 RepID=A0A3N4DJZ9_9GAMM|nr:DUF262 domain-containing protein [Shewanella psychromarinicola]AZG35779.1 DUF262 domain-containing protein [Shewanella psychromarinicola]MCL1084172.1 DUF262 domain-containing protein [Shewanella psychromarinicola]RPA22541.1 DUF262 domain-containing protein [Shewanella psychromarinicola]